MLTLSKNLSKPAYLNNNVKHISLFDLQLMKSSVIHRFTFMKKAAEFDIQSA